jgi:O-succinylhomoserine sulfhydrylase
MTENHHTRTMLIHDFFERSQFEEMSEPIYMTSGYTYKNAEEAEAAFKGETERYVYARYGNPTNSILEKRLAELEGGEACFVTSSGMAAVFSSLACCLKAGSRVVSSRALFGSCDYIIQHLLPRFGVETLMVEGTQLHEWEKALSKPTDVVFLESPSNPTLDIIDIPAVCTLAHQAGARVIVDNVFANPLVQKPLKLGADIVTYSTTKHMDGQGKTLGGAIIGSQKYIKELLTPFVRNTGPCMSPFVAWILIKSIETLPLRNDVMCQNALAIANLLEAHPLIKKVLYPGLKSHPQHALALAQMETGGNILSFYIKGGKEKAFALMNTLKTFTISNNHGDSKSIITHPATTTHQRLSTEERAAVGIDDSLVRIACGLEHQNDLVRDLEKSLDLL